MGKKGSLPSVEVDKLELFSWLLFGGVRSDVCPYCVANRKLHMVKLEHEIC